MTRNSRASKSAAKPRRRSTRCRASLAGAISRSRLASADVEQLLIEANEAVNREMMRQKISELCTWSRWEGRDEKYIKCPVEVADHLLSDPELGLPPLAGIVDAPFFDEDGNLVTRAGYHADSFTYYPRGRASRSWLSPQSVTRGDRSRTMPAHGGNRRRLPVRRRYPGEPVIQSSRRCPEARALCSAAHQRRDADLLQKPTPGTGATLFVNAFAQMAFGGPAVPQAEVRSADELRKNLTATLMTGTGLYWRQRSPQGRQREPGVGATASKIWRTAYFVTPTQWFCPCAVAGSSRATTWSSHPSWRVDRS